MTIDHSVMLREGTELLGGIYRIERQIASGGFGNTYVVTDTQLDERYALKEFFMRGINERRDGQTTVTVTGQQNRPQFEAQREKFKKEARRLSKLGNTAQPNRHIVKVKLLFEANDTAYYVMEYVDGESLSQRLKRIGKPLAEAEALDIVRQVLDGLAAVHAQQIWHLDLKPANILIERQTGRAVIIDFGASKQLSPTDGYTTTASAMAYTQGYAPAEQMEQDINRIGPWTDLYALGATLYNLLTGHTPPTLSAMLSGQAFRFPADVSAKTQHLVRWLMAPNPIQRPQSVKEVQNFLAGDFAADSVDAADTEQTVLEPEKDDKINDTVLDTTTGAVVVDNDDEAEETVIGDSDDIPSESSFDWRRIAWIVAVVAVVLFFGIWIMRTCGADSKSDVSDLMPEVIEPEILTAEDSVVYMPFETFTVNGVSFDMIRVEGGTFMMGATSEQGSDAYDDEKPSHRVTLSSYSIGETEVTQALWEAVMGSNPSRYKGIDRPVEQVSWEDCQIFLSRLNYLTSRTFRLPTEAEWEYAARGGNKSRGYKYSGSNTLGDVAWYYGNSSETHNVKTKAANELGLYDMSGNVWEWCLDWKGSYSSSSQTNPRGASSGSRRVNRGGGWYDFAGYCRVSNRRNLTPGTRDSDLGLRLAL